mmetsp:Transcript_25077/g.27817  ORF Transcript_25077/g.27817 Transcript_25077/m.27817 type:complete len:109 (+) Transcript_25077:9-335(+)
MSSNNKQPTNKFLQNARSMALKKAQKYAYHGKELLIEKRSELDQNLIDHIPYFKENYIEKFMINPLYFIRIKQDFRDYCKREFQNTRKFFNERREITMKKVRDRSIFK